MIVFELRSKTKAPSPPGFKKEPRRGPKAIPRGEGAPPLGIAVSPSGPPGGETAMENCNIADFFLHFAEKDSIIGKYTEF